MSEVVDPTPGIMIRNVQPADAGEAAKLSAELGYPVLVDVMAKRLAQFLTMDDHSVFGAYRQAQLIAWIDVGIVQHLQSGPYGEIGGLIVSRNYQGCGIGKALLGTAENWIASQNVEKILVRSQIAREGAHAFYTRQSFTHVKTSAVFTKSIQMAY